MGLSFLYGPTASDEDRLAFLDHVYESGQRHWDTSDLYGDSEELLIRNMCSRLWKGVSVAWA
jgi:aryl-alcohol dehydrogenase-like predicted oxidoreductase